MEQEQVYDVAIIGCGPAGLSAAVNAKIRQKEILILGGEFCSPKMNKSPWIDNYLGFPHINGEDLRQNFLKHLQEMGIKIHKAKVDSISPGEGGFALADNGGQTYTAKSIIIASGVAHTGYLPGEAEFLGKGVSYCGTCDAPFFKGKKVAVIAYTKEGEEEANFLADLCEEVYYIPLYKEIKTLKEQIKIVKQKPKAILGQEQVNTLELSEDKLAVEGVFIFREVTPVEQLVPGVATEEGQIKVNRDMATSLNGIFAAGDCTGKPFQLAKAVGEGQVAALNAVKFLEQVH